MEHHLHELPGIGKSEETESRQESGESKDRVTGGLLQLGGRDSYYQFHEAVKTLGLFSSRAKFMCMVYISITASLWSPSIYTSAARLHTGSVGTQ